MSTQSSILPHREDVRPNRWTKFSAVREYANAKYGRILFLLTFLLPTLIAVVFYQFVASDRYISETRFIVRSVDKPAAEGIAAYLQDFGILRANDDAFAIQDYIHSRDAMNELMKRVDLRRIYSLNNADFETRYHSGGRHDTNESLFRYIKKQVIVEENQETGITTVKVSAYNSIDAKRIADLILSLSEHRVNEMNERAHADALRLAQNNVKIASAAFLSSNIALSKYRNTSKTVDPEQSAGAATERNSALAIELAGLRANLSAMLAKAPANPAISAMKQRIAALEEQAAVQAGELTGEGNSLSKKLGNFERLIVERDLAERIYEAAQKQLENAQEQAARQQIYIETIARPNFPDEPLEPRRWRYIATVGLLSFWSFLIFYLLISGSREHLNLN